MDLKISCSDAVAEAIMATIYAIQAVSSTELITVGILRPEPPQRKAIAPRVHYVALAPVNAPDALKALGAHTITGIIFGDVVAGTVKGDIVTERGLRTARHFNAAAVQRSLVQLRQAGLIESQHITA